MFWVLVLLYHFPVVMVRLRFWFCLFDFSPVIHVLGFGFALPFSGRHARLGFWFCLFDFPAVIHVMGFGFA